MRNTHLAAAFGLGVLGFIGASVLPLHDSPVARITAKSEQAFFDASSHAFHKIAMQAMPSVVSISAVKIAALHSGVARPFGQMPAPSEGAMSFGIGSGVIIRPDGFILTNNHVVENANKVTVLFDEKHRVPATVIGTDTKTDLAVIRLDERPRALNPILFGDSDSTGIGDWVLAIGSPFGLNQSVTSGIVSAKGRGQMGILDIEDFIQTDAAINPGNSGGPLLNSKGEMIGLNTAIFSQNGGSMGIGFAIPSKIAKEISDELIKHGKVTRGYMGLLAQDLDPALARFFKVKSGTNGALISEVLPNGPGALATLQPGDVILKFGQTRVETSTQFKVLVGKSPVGAHVPIEVLRDGVTNTVIADIGEQPVPVNVKTIQLAGQKAEGHDPTFGLAVENVPREIADYLGLTDRRGAMVVGVRPGSPAFDAGLAPGDIIRRANESEILNARTLLSALKGMPPEDTAVLYIKRGRLGHVFVPLKTSY